MLPKVLVTVALLAAALLMAGCPPNTSSSGTEQTSPKISKTEAIRILTDEVIRPDSLNHDLIAFTLDQPLNKGTKVSPYAPDPLPAGVSALPYLVDETMASRAWFFWIDDSPFASFSHPTRYVFIDADSGKVRVVDQGWWPYINGEVVSEWVAPDSRWNEDNWAYSNVNTEEIPGKTALSPNRNSRQVVLMVSFSGADIFSWTEPPALPAGEAMVHVNGWGPGQVDAGFSDDMGNAARFNGNSQIPKYMPNGTSEPDIENAIKRAVDAGANDVFFYYTGHGGRTADGKSYMAFKNNVTTPEEISAMFKKFCSVRFKVVLQGCYLGGFADTLMNSGKVDIFMSAANGEESSYGDWDPTKVVDGERVHDSNLDPDGPGDTGSEFSSGMWAGLEAINGSADLQKKAKDLAKEKSIPEFAAWLALANETALANDSTYRKGLTHPIIRINDKPVQPCDKTTPPPSLPPTTTTPPPTETTLPPTTTTQPPTTTTQPPTETTPPPTTTTPPPTTTTPPPTTPPPTTPPPTTTTTPPPTTTTQPPPTDLISSGYLQIPLGMSAESVGPPCSSTVTVSYSATLSGEIDVYITNVTATLTGKAGADSGSINTRDYHNTFARPAECGETLTLTVTVTLSDGQIYSNSGTLTTPVPE